MKPTWLLPVAGCLAGVMLTGCGGTDGSTTVSSPAVVPAASSVGVAGSAGPVLPSELPPVSTVASLLPPPLSTPVDASISTPFTAVTTEHAEGWYAVLGVRQGNGLKVVADLASGLAVLGYEVVTSPGSAVGTLYAGSSGVLAPDTAVTPSAAPSVLPSVAPTVPVVPELPGVSLSPVVPGVRRIPAVPVRLPVGWVEIRSVTAFTPAGAPTSSRDYVTVLVMRSL